MIGGNAFRACQRVPCPGFHAGAQTASAPTELAAPGGPRSAPAFGAHRAGSWSETTEAATKATVLHRGVINPFEAVASQHFADVPSSTSVTAADAPSSMSLPAVERVSPSSSDSTVYVCASAKPRSRRMDSSFTSPPLAASSGIAADGPSLCGQRRNASVTLSPSVTISGGRGNSDGLVEGLALHNPFAAAAQQRFYTPECGELGN